MSTCHFPLPHKPIFCYSFVCSVSEGVDPCGLLHLGFLVFWQQVGFRQSRAAPGNCRKGGKWAGSSFSTFSSVLIASSSLYLQVLLSIPAAHCPAQPQKHSPLCLVRVTASCRCLSLRSATSLGGHIKSPYTLLEILLMILTKCAFSFPLRSKLIGQSTLRDFLSVE